ncbi:MAG: crossover junction endodeoxyribonuclease RuvC [Limisphaerales bacterium]
MGISARQFEEMQQRVQGRGPASAPEKSAETPSHTILLGVDPSLRGTGYGVVKLGGEVPATLDQGTIKCPAKWSRSECLVAISRTLRETIDQHAPTVCAVEGLFFAQNVKTALIMGEARGAAMAAVAESGLEIFEIAPRKVKQSIVGYGNAQKLAVAKMVQRMLALKELPAPDAADALALALTYAHLNKRFAIDPTQKI